MDAILKEARERYNEIATAYVQANYYATHPLNEFWGSVNLRTMRDLILKAQSAQEVVHGAQRTMMFSVNSEEQETARRAVGWLLDERGHRLFQFPWLGQLDESEFSFPGNNVIWDYGRTKYTPDFLRCVNIAAEILKHTGREKKDVVELGGGLGHLARVLRQGQVSRSHVIIDLPETLFFSFCFLKQNFPHSSFQWLRPGEEMAAGIDFTFVPAMLCDRVAWRKYDLFVNTASMGEMRNEVIRQWMDFVQKRLSVDYLFTLNRFLNTINERLRWRVEENECQQHYDRNWSILDWELEPSYTRCPWVDSRVSRYVQIVAKRTRPEGHAHAEERTETADQRAESLLDELRSQDWYRHWDKGHVMGMRDGPICNDGSIHGTIFKLWDLVRLRPCASAYDLMVKYLAKITPPQPGEPVMFEEVPYYVQRLHELSLSERVRAGVAA